MPGNDVRAPMADDRFEDEPPGTNWPTAFPVPARFNFRVVAAPSPEWITSIIGQQSRLSLQSVKRLKRKNVFEVQVVGENLSVIHRAIGKIREEQKRLGSRG